MQSIRTKFSVGLFVIIGMSVVILAILWLGMSDYLREGRKFSAYFDESVQGLSQDAAVKYRGVSVGRVDQIGVAPDGRLVEIIFSLNKKLGNTKNLVAQIKSVGITGIMFVELERQQPGQEIHTPSLDFETKYPVVATKPSEMKQLLSDVYDILSRIKQIDMKGISDRLTTIMDNVNQLLTSEKIEKFSASLQETVHNSNQLIRETQKAVSEARKTVNRIDMQIASSAENFDLAIDEVYRAAERAEKTFATGTRSVEAVRRQAAKYDRRMMQILEDLESVSANLNRLLEQLNRQPSRIIFGKPLPEKTVAPEGN